MDRIWPFATITIDEHRVTVPGAELRREDVVRVMPSADARRLSGYSVVLQLQDNTLWPFHLGPAKKVLRAFETLGWPADRHFVVSMKESFDAAQLPGTDG
jgi:hypothetical protein